MPVDLSKPSPHVSEKAFQGYAGYCTKSTLLDRISATLSAIQIRQRRTESPREYYRCIRGAYFQGSNTPGQEEDERNRSMFLHNIHPSVRTHVTLAYEQNKYTIGEIKRIIQTMWETVVRSADTDEEGVRALGIQSEGNAELRFESRQVPLHRVSSRTAPPERLPHHQQGEGRTGGVTTAATLFQNRRRGQNSFRKKGNAHFDHF